MKIKIKYVVLLLFICILISAYFMLDYWNLIPKKSYLNTDFNIVTIKSPIDYNQNNIDDYTDILVGARKYINTKPRYQSAYYAGGYPPNGVGVCTDVIWNAFKEAGYLLKDLVNEDIINNPSSYPLVDKADANIDFRRVRNLKIFFDRHATSLTLDASKIEEWQPGDIVVYSNHIAIVSDKRNKNGKPYIIHHAGQPNKEEDALTRKEIIGHYRFDGI